MQKVADALENIHLLDKAAEEKNSLLRVAYIAAFNASQYNACLGDRLKPFNPILGETYEFVTSNYNFISEQVSHHPPIGACHCENKNYIMYFHTQVTNKFWGNSLEFRPLGRMWIELKNLKEKYKVTRPITCARNIIFGHLYLDLAGDTTAENDATGEKCVLHFIGKGWKADSLGMLEGFVINKEGDKIYKIHGKWCDSISATDLKTGEVIVLWKKFPLPPDWHNVHCFTMHSLQLNYLPQRLRPFLPPTDSRLRPDVRAYENGDSKLAATEKFRLEEKQRAARKIQEQKKIEYKPAYFTRVTDPITKEDTYLFNGLYWKDREATDWRRLPDIF